MGKLKLGFRRGRIIATSGRICFRDELGTIEDDRQAVNKRPFTRLRF